MLSNLLAPEFLRGVIVGAVGAVLVSILQRHERMTIPAPPDTGADEIRRFVIRARTLLSTWIGFSLLLERHVAGEGPPGQSFGELEAAALELRSRTFLLLEPDSDHRRRPPGPPAAVG